MSKNHFYQDIKSIVEKTKIIDAQTFRIFDNDFHIAYKHPYMKWNQPLNVFGQNFGEEKKVQSNLTSQIASALYSSFYCTGRTDITSYDQVQKISNYPTKEEREITTHELSQLNQTKESENPLWRVYSIDQNGTAYVTKNGQVRYLVPNHWSFNNPSDKQLKLGTLVNIKLAKEDTKIQEVFYHVKSEQIVSQQAGYIRIYFNTNFEGAKVLVKQITSQFNKYQVPFLFKCLNHPNLYNRSDSAVLYVNRAYFKIAFQLLHLLIPKLTPFLKKEVPLFSLPIAQGVSFSEDPGDGQSFGMSRCKILSEALVEAFNKNKNNAKEKLEIVEGYLKKNGLDIENMHLKPNSQFPYDFTLFNSPKN